MPPQVADRSGEKESEPKICRLVEGDMLPRHCNGKYHDNIAEPTKDNRCLSKGPCIHQTFEGMGIQIALAEESEGLWPHGALTNPYPEELNGEIKEEESGNEYGD